MSTAVLLLSTAILIDGSTAPNTLTDVSGQKPDHVAARLDQVDEDFAFQGEYLGQVRAVDGRTVSFGLQVAALGAGQFSALGYQGGLPGNGWDLETTISWNGSRNGNTLLFDGPRGRIILQAGEGSVIDSSGTAVGQISKVRRISCTLGAPPPPDAVVLFDGTDTAQFEGGKFTAEGFLDIGAVTRMPVHDFQLHLEFRTPFMPHAKGQARGNSGIYIQRRYEVQILDSFGLPPAFNGCGALYRQQVPELNMSFPPLSWQTYDIYFKAASWDTDGNKIANAEISVIQNGVPIHRNYEIPAKTGAGSPETPEDGPIRFQNHGDPVRFRNIWLVVADEPAAPDQFVAETEPSDVREFLRTTDQDCDCSSAVRSSSLSAPTTCAGSLCPGQGGWILWKGDYPF